MPIIHSDVEVDKDTHEFRIKHTWDEGACLRECYESRMSGKEGWIEGKKANGLPLSLECISQPISNCAATYSSEARIT